jgi:transcriptional regulator with XRE-family HTH domain
MKNNHPKQRVAWNIRRIRVRQGLSQEQLATDSSIDTSYISRLERALENPTIGTLDRIAKALGVGTADLLAKPRGKAPKPLPGGRKPR